MHTVIDTAAWASRLRTRSLAGRVLLSAGLLSLALSSATWWSAGAMFCLVTLVAVLFARVPVRSYLLALAAPGAFLAIGAVAMAVSIGAAAEPVWTLGPLAITRESIETSGLLTTRALAASAAVILLACTTPITELLAGMKRIGVPGPVLDIAGSTYNMVFLLWSQAQSVSRSQRARLGYSSPRAAVRSVGGLLSTLLITALARARRLDVGLAGRGAGGPLVSQTPAVPLDAAFAAALVLVLAMGGAIVALGWRFG